MSILLNCLQSPEKVILFPEHSGNFSTGYFPNLYYLILTLLLKKLILVFIYFYNGIHNIIHVRFGTQ